MNTLTVTDDHCALLKQRSLDFIVHINTCEDPSKVVDVKLIKIINQLNNLPGVATVFCCEGHVNSDHLQNRALHVVLGVTSLGYGLLTSVYLQLFNALPYGEQHKLVLKNRHLRCPISMGFYNSVTLEFENGYIGSAHENYKLMFIGLLEHILDKMILELTC